MFSILNKFYRKKNIANLTFSQCGEDAIVCFLLNWLGAENISYLDLGANHPIKFNNTYRLYISGASGILVEPDEELAKEIIKERPNDICINLAVGATNATEVTFYKMTEGTLNTTTKKTAALYEKNSTHKIISECTVKSIHINTLLNEHYENSCPDFVSLDVEGLDIDLLSAWDFSRWKPKVFCVETLTYTQNKTCRKITEIFDLMTAAGYIQYADTYINTIFVSASAWERRLS